MKSELQNLNTNQESKETTVKELKPMPYEFNMLKNPEDGLFYRSRDPELEPNLGVLITSCSKDSTENQPFIAKKEPKIAIGPDCKTKTKHNRALFYMRNLHP